MNNAAFYLGLGAILLAIWTLLQALITSPYRAGRVAGLVLRQKGADLNKETQIVASVALLAIGSFVTIMSHPLLPSWLTVIAAFVAIVLSAGLHHHRTGAEQFTEADATWQRDLTQAPRPMPASSDPSLPRGWLWSTQDDQQRLLAEYATELPSVHPLANTQVQVIAHREGSDDILVRCPDSQDRVAVVHLTWIGREEMANHPTLEYVGSFTGFVKWELETYGVGLSAGDEP